MGFLAETANNFPSDLTKVCPHHNRSDGSEAAPRWGTRQESLTSANSEDSDNMGSPKPEAALAQLQGGHFHVAFLHCLLRGRREEIYGN